MKTQIVACFFALILVVDSCSALGLLGALGYGNPMMGGCGCGCGMAGYGLTPRPPLGLAYPGACCLSVTKPCLLSKLFLLKKKLMDKKMSLLGACGCGMGCGLCK